MPPFSCPVYGDDTARSSCLAVASGAVDPDADFEEISLAWRARVHADNGEGWTVVIDWLQKHVEAAG